MKTEVYSWRLTPEKKADLEAEVRRAGITLSKLLDDMTTTWLNHQRNGHDHEDAEQAALRKRVMATVGTIRSGDPLLANKARDMVRERILRKHVEETNAPRRPH